MGRFLKFFMGERAKFLINMPDVLRLGNLTDHIGEL
jgi:hypothetical protein